ncbi:nucleoside phosphorylase [Pseudonocardia acaciae]|uniref:nucleoside phosphorylase n=1 Tax=Pseudonocardia acaciae TaxID=551276 RepID=UPI00048B4718|nr:nucleoside phosphorylase [Pseudonocardia acaciae]
MNPADLPLAEFDADSPALIDPGTPALTEPLPPRVVMCFFPEVVAGLAASHGARRIGSFSRELGRHEIYLVHHDETPLAVLHPGVGAPLAVLHLERAIAAGARAVVACGGAGAVAPELALGHIVVPDAAVRDEGTSFHYAPPSRLIRADAEAVATVVDVLDRHEIPRTVGTTWTTDAPYRETVEKIKARRAEGCVTVEMEAAAFIAVAAFRRIRFAQLLYAGDDVSGQAWDERRWTTSRARPQLLDLALETARRLPV